MNTVDVTSTTDNKDKGQKRKFVTVKINIKIIKFQLDTV